MADDQLRNGHLMSKLVGIDDDAIIQIEFKQKPNGDLESITLLSQECTESGLVRRERRLWVWNEVLPRK